MSIPSYSSQQKPTATVISPASSPARLKSPRSSPPLRRLLDETADLIDSPSFSQILTLLLDTTFSHLTDVNVRSQAFKLPFSSLSQIQELPSTAILASQDRYDPLSASTKLATILAVVTRQAHVIGNGILNEYVQTIEGVRELEAFAAVIYCSNFELEIVGEVGAEQIEEQSRLRSGAAGRGK